MMLRDDLIAARALIDTPEKWALGPLVEDGRRCAIRAIEAVVHTDVVWRKPKHPAYQALCEALPSEWTDEHGLYSVGTYNDAHEHADIMALFDRAIQAATPEPENKS
jgi:hypothetical protein